MEEKRMIVNASIPESMVKAIDEHGENEKRSRSNMIEVLLEEALKARKESKRGN